MSKDEVIQELKEVLSRTQNVEVCRVINGVLAFLEK